MSRGTCLVCMMWLCTCCWCNALPFFDDPPASDTNVKPAIEVPSKQVRSETRPVNWAGLFKQSFLFLSVEHGFREAAQPDTRAAGYTLGGGYTSSVGNLHGWADGDNFLTNYVGHPMQGAVASYIWFQNDPAYDNVEIGRDPRYWKSRLRGMAFAFVYSEQFEVGPFSEASLGKTQRSFPPGPAFRRRQLRGWRRRSSLPCHAGIANRPPTSADAS